MNINEYKKWIEKEDNGLIKIKKISPNTYKLLFKPLTYELLSLGFKTKKEIQTNKNKYVNMDHYRFTIHNDLKKSIIKFGEDDEFYYDKLNYASFDMENDFTLITNKDTLKPVFCHFEQSQSTRDELTFLIGFKHIKLYDPIKIVYENNLIDGAIMTFQFDKKHIIESNQINIK
jgi:hypothetical protein